MKAPHPRPLRPTVLVLNFTLVVFVFQLSEPTAFASREKRNPQPASEWFDTETIEPAALAAVNSFDPEASACVRRQTEELLPSRTSHVLGTTKVRNDEELRYRLKQIRDVAFKFNGQTAVADLRLHYPRNGNPDMVPPPLGLCIKGEAPVSEKVVANYEAALTALGIPLPAWSEFVLPNDPSKRRGKDYILSIVKHLTDLIPESPPTSKTILETGNVATGYAALFKQLVQLEQSGLVQSRLKGRKRVYTIGKFQDRAQRPGEISWNGIPGFELYRSEEFSKHNELNLLGYVLGTVPGDLARALQSEADATQTPKILMLFQEAIVAGMLRAYADLQSPGQSGRYPTSQELLSLQGARAEHAQITLDPAQLDRALEWLDLKGFVLRRRGPAWRVAGVLARRPDLLYSPSWSLALRTQWQALKGQQSHAAASLRVELLMQAAGVEKDGLPPLIWRRLLEWRKNDNAMPDDTFDEGLESFADALGVEPMTLRRGSSRTEAMREFHSLVPSLTRGGRVRFLRHIQGKSCKSLALETGVAADGLRTFERRPNDTFVFSNPSDWKALAEVLGVDPFLILEGMTENEFLLAPMDARRRILGIQRAVGITEFELAQRAGVSRESIRHWRLTGALTLTPTQLLQAARGKLSVDEVTKLRIAQPFSAVRPRQWEVLRHLSEGPLLESISKAELTLDRAAQWLGVPIKTLATTFAELRRSGYLFAKEGVRVPGASGRVFQRFGLTEAGTALLHGLRDSTAVSVPQVHMKGRIRSHPLVVAS